MSTKIYDAYRIEKSRDILPLMQEIKKYFLENFPKDMLVYLTNTVKYKMAKDFDPTIKDRKDEFIKQRLFDLEIANLTRKCFREHDIIEFLLPSTILYDDNYWYIKFYINLNRFGQLIDEIQQKFELQDYHYQNQTDRPNGISEEQWSERSAKWEKLLAKHHWNFKNFFQFNIIDDNDYYDMLSEFKPITQ